MYIISIPCSSVEEFLEYLRLKNDDFKMKLINHFDSSEVRTEIAVKMAYFSRKDLIHSILSFYQL